ncbi:hypothetical protein CHL78_009485 [Romboutsia weinsteinii]|uniref:Glycosyl transferase family 28 C-terminal domain-containing protein n=1 Tax=Romboutsia weinsteinii TaxID=2020949 RepID=A0A371J441_9FIRM|nr:glycosyltransferase [Romboutsia weinsteinii]RDY27436.1 hypothetical protein CHL78_009485 [Romboutsia weinsteinii]
MYIAFYISSHGFGHMTRCLSLIENILNDSKYKVYIVCDKKQNEFARIYLSKFEDRIIYKDIVTDVGLVNKNNSLEVDIVALKQKLDEFILSLDNIVKSECDFLRAIDIKCVVNDISPIGCIVGNKLNLPNIFVSNFSWVEQYEHLGIDNRIISKFKKAYSYVDKFIRYDLCLPMSSIDADEIYEAGFVCRNIDETKVNDIQQRYGESIFITCGKSVSLNSISISNFRGTIFTTSGIDIVCSKDCNVVNLPIEVLDTQNYIAASDIVITKAGWGTIAECIISHSSLVLIERPTSYEDSVNILKAKERNLAISITENELLSIDIDDIKHKLEQCIDYKSLEKYKNDLETVSHYILGM